MKERNMSNTINFLKMNGISIDFLNKKIENGNKYISIKTFQNNSNKINPEIVIIFSFRNGDYSQSEMIFIKKNQKNDFSEIKKFSTESEIIKFAKEYDIQFRWLNLAEIIKNYNL